MRGKITYEELFYLTSKENPKESFEMIEAIVSDLVEDEEMKLYLLSDSPLPYHLIDDQELDYV